MTDVGKTVRGLGAAAMMLALLLAPARAHAQRPSELRGTPSKLARQNELADRYDLSRMDGPSTIRRLADAGRLVRVPSSGKGYFVDGTIARNYRHRALLVYARPWVRDFVSGEGVVFTRRFPGSRLKVSSLVRTEDYQQLLKRRNVNAAPGSEDRNRSPHLTGAAVDISKKGLSARQLAWLRQRFVELQDRGWIVATEEMRTSTFHIFVTPDYGRTRSGDRDGR